MSGSPSQIRLLVMVLVGWCALSAAPVVANSPALPAAFFVIAVGLVAAVTLRFSTLVGLLMAVLGTALFAVSMVLDPATAASRGSSGIGGAITRLDQLLPALVAAVSLVGVAVCASLASWEIDGRPGAIQEVVVRRAGADEEEAADGRASQEGDERGYAAAVAEEHAAVERPAGVETPAEPAPAGQPGREGAAARAAEVRHAEEAAASPAAEEATAAARPAEPAEPAEPAAAATAEGGPERPPTEEVADRPADEEAAALETAAAAPPRNGEPASDDVHPPVEQTPAITEPVPSPEPLHAKGRAGGQDAAEAAEAERPEGAAAAPAETAAQAGDVKGEEIAREFEDKNGRAEGDQRQAAGPDWRHRRRPDDDAARRLPRRRKR